jgi:cysteine synthase
MMMCSSTEPAQRASACTPLHAPTDLLEVMPGVLAKFECNNPGGSHKVRAARYIVRAALEQGLVVPGQTTLIEKTGGNFGFGLVVEAVRHGLSVDLAVGLSFSPVKRRWLEWHGARLIGVDMLEAGASPREVVEWHIANAESLERQYFYTDQFNNAGGVAAHEFETAPELAIQLRAWPQAESITFVACAGTGASLTGIARGLGSAGYGVEVVLVEPDGCDSRKGMFVGHRLEGMAVGAVPPFVDWELIAAVETVSYETAMRTQQTFAQRTGFLIGNTSAACFAVAMKRARATSSRHKTLALIYDHGLWYA